VVTFVADMHADVVQDRRVLEPFALPIGKPVDGARLIEERRGEPRHLRRVLRPVVAPLGQLDDAAASDVGIAIGLGDLLPVARDVIENQSFTKREVAECEVRRVQPSNDRIEQNRAGDRQVRPPRLQTRNREPTLEIERDQFLAHPMQLFRRNAAVPELRVGRSTVGRDGDGAEAQDRSRRPDQPIESGARDFVEVISDFFFDMPDELAFITRLDRIALDVALGEPDDPDLEAATQLDVRTGAACHFDAAAADVDD